MRYEKGIACAMSSQHGQHVQGKNTCGEKRSGAARRPWLPSSGMNYDGEPKDAPLGNVGRTYC